MNYTLRYNKQQLNKTINMSNESQKVESKESNITEQEAKDFLKNLEEQRRLKRVEELKPDKDKVLSFIRSLSFKEEIPDVNDKELVDVLDSIIDFVRGYKEGVEERIYKIN